MSLVPSPLLCLSFPNSLCTSSGRPPVLVGLSSSGWSLMAFVGARVLGPLPPLSLSGWDHARWRQRRRRGRREASPMREGTAPLQPWFGIFCAGNEKPGVAMETAIPCSLCHSLWEVPTCRGWGRCAGDSPAALSAGMQKRQLWGWWRGRGGCAGKDGVGNGVPGLQSS